MINRTHPCFNKSCRCDTYPNLQSRGSCFYQTQWISLSLVNQEDKLLFLKSLWRSLNVLITFGEVEVLHRKSHYLGEFTADQPWLMIHSFVRLLVKIYEINQMWPNIVLYSGQIYYNSLIMKWLIEQKHPICVFRVKMCIYYGAANSGQYVQTLVKCTFE